MRWAILLLLAVSVGAQTNGFAPSLVQSSVYEQSGHASSPINVAYLDNVTSGDLLILCLGWADNNANVFTVTDTQGVFPGTATATLTSTNGDSANTKCFYTTAGSTGAETVHVAFSLSPSQMVFHIAEFTNISATLDTSCTAKTSAATATQTTSCTSTVNGDLAITFGNTWSSSTQIYCAGSPPIQFATGTGANVGAAMCWDISGAAGSYSATMGSNQQANPAPNWNMMTLMFEPSAITIATSSPLPAGAQTTAYKACLFENGGAGAVTWSALSGLPGWATVSSSPSGCPSLATGMITGTPNANATSSINMQVTDGTHTTTRTLSLTTGSAFQTPQLVQYVQFQGTVPTLPSPVHQGDLIILDLYGRTTQGSSTWIPKANGTNNVLSDSLNTVFVRVSPIIQVQGNQQADSSAPLRYAGITTTCGADTITYAVNDPYVGGTFQFPMGVEEWAGVQSVVDPGAGATTAGLSTGAYSLTTANYTAQVANEVLSVLGSGGVLNVPSFNSPFTQVFGNISGTVDLVSAYDAVTTATTYTATLAGNNGGAGNSSSGSVAIELNGLRPGLTASTCANLAQSNDRYHRVPW